MASIGAVECSGREGAPCVGTGGSGSRASTMATRGDSATAQMPTEPSTAPRLYIGGAKST